MKKIITFLFGFFLVGNIFAQEISLTKLVSLCAAQSDQSVSQTLSNQYWERIYFDADEWPFAIPPQTQVSAWKKNYSKIILICDNHKPASVILEMDENGYDELGLLLLLIDDINMESIELTDADEHEAVTFYLQGDKQFVHFYEYTFVKDYALDYAYTHTMHYAYVTNIGSVDDPNNGTNKEYDANGNLIREYTLRNSEIDGECTIYEYNDSGKLIKKEVQNYSNGRLNGRSYIYLQTENGLEEYSFATYEMGVLNGAVCDVQDSLVTFCEYQNGHMTGPVTVYSDDHFAETGIISRDTTKLRKLAEGRYLKDQKQGNWTYYYAYPWSAGHVRSTGQYLNDQFNGTWTYFLPTEMEYGTGSRGNKKKLTVPHGGEEFLEEQYQNGQLHGTVTRYGKFSVDGDPHLTMQAWYEADFEKTTYQYGKKNGPYELRDDAQQIVESGSYKNDLKDGDWLFVRKLRFNEYWLYRLSSGKYKDGKMEGKWQYGHSENTSINDAIIFRTATYSNDLLDGEWVEYSNNRVKFKKQFSQNKMTELFVNNNDGTSVKYVLSDRTDKQFHCVITIADLTSTTVNSYTLPTISDMDEPTDCDNFIKAVNQAITDPKTFDGDFATYDFFENLIESGRYINGRKSGNWTYVDNSQRVKVVYSYDNDHLLAEFYYNLDGTLFAGDYVYEDDKIKEERSIKNGMRNGKTTTYDKATGKVISKQMYKDGLFK